MAKFGAKFGKVLAISLAAAGFAASAGIANATGYIRIGDECFFNAGGSYPVLIQIPCPDEVSENP
ncbi:MAG: hypothetical protein ACK4YM_00490 [Novosphingobium sp.]